MLLARIRFAFTHGAIYRKRSGRAMGYHALDISHPAWLRFSRLDATVQSLTIREFRARRNSAVQDSRTSTARVRKNRKEVLPMVKHVYSWIKSIVPAALVSVSWLAFVAGILVSEPVAKIALLSLARVLP